MKKVTGIVAVFLIVSILSLSLVSAFSFGDFFKNLFKQKEIKLSPETGIWIKLNATNQGKTATQICQENGYENATKAKRCDKTGSIYVFPNKYSHQNCKIINKKKADKYQDCFDFCSCDSYYNKKQKGKCNGVVWDSVFCDREKSDIINKIRIVKDQGYCNDFSCAITPYGANLSFEVYSEGSIEINPDYFKIFLYNSTNNLIKEETFRLVKEGKIISSVIIPPDKTNFKVIIKYFSKNITDVSIKVVPFEDFEFKKIKNASSTKKLSFSFFYTDKNLTFEQIVSFARSATDTDNAYSLFSFEPISDYISYFEVAAIKNPHCSNDYFCGRNLMDDVYSYFLSQDNKERVYLLETYISENPSFGATAVFREDRGSVLFLYTINNPPNNKTIGQTLTHEFGHAFGNLGDEYFLNYYSFRINVPNIDREGCPKWCNGTLNKNNENYTNYQQLKKCLNNYTDSDNNLINNDKNSQRISECLINYTEYYNWELGIECQNNTGCYFTAAGLLEWRSSEDSMMRNSFENTNFNEVSKTHLNQRFKMLLGL